jgi:hypothetical protein
VSLEQVAGTGDTLELLRALRDRLARDLDETDSKRDVASLSQRLLDVTLKINELGGAAKTEPPKTGLSDFERKLRDRTSASSRTRRTTG